jgi:hypothetical protein
MRLGPLEAPTNAAGDDTAMRDDEHSDVECREMERRQGRHGETSTQRESEREREEKETQI